MTPKISLIIPIYNAERYLQPCLDSVAAQTMFSDTQVILVNDGSTDASAQLCDAFVEAHANVQVLHRTNAGVSAARNAGIDAAAGKYLAFADADDLLMPQMLETLYDAAERTGAQMAMCAFLHPYPDKEVTITYPFEENVLLPRSVICGEVADFMIRDEAMNALWNKLFLREAVEQNALRMTIGKKYAEDREFILHFLASASGMCYVPYVGYYYRYVETGAIQRPRTDYAVRLAEQFEMDSRDFAALGISPQAYCRRGAVCWGSKIVGSISFIESKLKGKVRRQTLRAFIQNTQMRDLLAQICDKQQTQTRYNRLMLYAAERKSVLSIHVLFCAMRIKVTLQNRIKGRDDV